MAALGAVVDGGKANPRVQFFGTLKATLVEFLQAHGLANAIDLLSVDVGPLHARNTDQRHGTLGTEHTETAAESVEVVPERRLS